jgi:sorting nexin-29
MKVLRQGEAIAPLLFNVVLEIAIRISKVETKGTIFDKCGQIMAYANDVFIMGKRLQDVKKYLLH